MSTTGVRPATDVEVDLDAPAVGPGRDGPTTGEEEGAPGGPGSGAGAGTATPPLGERLARWPASSPAWLRGPGAAVAVAVAAAAVSGGLVAHRGAAVVDERVAARTALVSLAVGAVQVRGMYRLPTREREDPRAGRSGWSDASVEVTVVNRGEHPVRVRVTALSGPAALGDLADPEDAVVRVAAGSTRVARLPLVVDCAEVPPVPAASSGASSGQRDWVDADVGVLDAAGGTGPEQRVRLPVTQLGPSTTEQLAWGCDPRGGWSVAAVPVEVDDGALVLLVRNSSGRPTTLVPDDAPGVELVADPPLPARLPADRSSRVVLRLEVDCTRVGSALDLAHGVDLLVSPDGDPAGLGGGYPVVDPAALGAWVASEVAATCR